MFDRPQGGERALLVHVELLKDMVSDGGRAQTSDRRADYAQEFLELALSAGADPVAQVHASRYTPDARYFVGSGKAEEVAEVVRQEEVELVLIDQSLSPSQERNLEALFKCRVLDRTGLILDIFAQRARSFEGKLQVELAQLKHLSTRLIRGWTHLERQKGGIGMRGPGESQLETDRRLIGARIKLLERKLQKVSKQRQQGRAYRQKSEIPTVSLVGYTNAGKSSLFNRLTEAEVYAQDQLFATLDPTLRQLQLPSKQKLVLADTVGFIRDLPHDLVAAFRSTLQETEEATLLLHVIDYSDEEYPERMQEVYNVLEYIGAETIPQLLVFNKLDAVEHSDEYTPEHRTHIKYDEQGIPTAVYLSAHTGEGIDELFTALGKLIEDESWLGQITLTHAEGKLRAQLYAMGVVESEHTRDDGHSVLTARFSDEVLGKLKIDVQRVIKNDI